MDNVPIDFVNMHGSTWTQATINNMVIVCCALNIVLSVLPKYCLTQPP